MMTLFAFALTLLLIAGVSMWMRRHLSAGVARVFWVALVIKLVAGLCLGMIYSFVYVGDTFTYYRDAMTLHELATVAPGEYLNVLWNSDRYPEVVERIVSSEARSLFFVKLLSVVLLATNGNYWLASLWFSFFSFAGTWTLAKRLVEADARFQYAAWISFLFFPTVVFWSSGVIKESIAFGSLCFLVAFFLDVYRHKQIPGGWWLIVLPSGYFVWWLKYYWAVVLFACLFATLIAQIVIKSARPQRRFTPLVLWCLIFIILVGMGSFLHPNFRPQRLLDVITENYRLLVNTSGSAAIHFFNLESTWRSVLINSPWALFSGLFRPLPNEASTFFQLVTALENLMILVFAAANVRRFPKLLTGSYRILTLGTIVYVVVLCVFLTLSTPNLGTLSRYRIGFMPFFLLVVMIHNPLLSWLMRKGRDLVQ